MSYLEYSVKRVPAGFRKLLHMNWALAVVLTAIASVGFLMLYSVADGRMDRWAEPQMERFGLGLALMLGMGLVPIWFWRNMAGVAYGVSLLLLVAVELVGAVGMGAQRWLELGPLRLQPSELMKVALVMMLAAYYDWLDPKKTSRPLWVLVPVAMILFPTFLVLRQPDLGTSVMLMGSGAAVMLVAGVHWAYFASVIAMAAGAVASVFLTRGTEWQVLRDYQYRRIDTFLDPGSDPLGAGYHISQAKIALGSGGWAGKGFMQGTQSRLNFLPEKHTDFIFNTLTEEFGFVGGFSLLMLYALVLVFCIATAIQTKDRFASLVSMGVAATFFLYFAVNMAMVMGLVPVVGSPLPLVSYGGTAMIVLMIGFGLVQSAHVHRPR
ncbi:MAG: rod shape-determining protein RodA [Gemmobacter sp.]|uniref:rod shape-determining protein RodA n=1 Tax=Gemmobacter sp. TaxID=1898957 RepID=UPI00391C3675